MAEFFTPLNVEQAAIIGGDPHDIHYRQNSLGFQIVGGLYQLTLGLLQTGWKQGHQIELRFHKPITLPTSASYHTTLSGFELCDEKTTFTIGTVTPTKLGVREQVWAYSCRYAVSDKEIAIADVQVNWKNLQDVSGKAMLQVLPPGSYSEPFLLALLAVNLQANTLVRYFNEHREVLPLLHYPGLREGSESVLETKLTVLMEQPLSSLDAFTIYAAEPQAVPGSRREIVLAVKAEGAPSGSVLYSGEMQLTRMQRRALERKAGKVLSK